MYRIVLQKFKRILPITLQERLRKTRALAGLAWRDFQCNLFGLRQIRPMKPRAISFMANDICNSRCVMCLIWNRKKDKELSVDEFLQVLAEPLFSKVRHVGITGGEPTLRKDLPDLFRAVAERRPRIQGASLITNAIRERDVRDRVLEIARICRENGVGFSVTVSLDGVGEVHDTNRGRPGNFQSAVNCLHAFQEAGVPTSFGCTITKGNAAYVDELLDWAIEHDISARFQVGEFIERLYNASRTDHIRSFTPLERYHLGLFFHRLATTYELNSTVRKTYASILGMLAEGEKRTTGCPSHTDMVILTARGELLYCSPKSPNLGSILVKGSASRVYFGNIDKRREIIREHCDDCIHNYQVPVSFREKVAFYFKHRRIGRAYHCARLLQWAKRIPAPTGGPVNHESLTSRRVLIVGWYGTETAGDKAILWSIVRRLQGRAQPPVEITVTSFHPWVTEWTKRELGLPELSVVKTYSKAYEQACAEADEIVIGGGPLMDLESLNHMLFAFATAARRGAVTRVEGCGIGPLRDSRYVPVVREILRLSHYLTLRDSDSVRRARDEFSCASELVPDPAEEYVQHCLDSGLISGRRTDSPTVPTANFFVREWPHVYAEGLDDGGFADLSHRFEEELLLFMEELVTCRGLRLNLLSMNTLSDGGDDRVFNRRLARQLMARGVVRPEQVSFARLPTTPLDILREMWTASLNVCMRYHSVLFADALGTEFLAIDYTGGGKVHGFLVDRGKVDRLITLENFANGNWRQSFTPG